MISESGSVEVVQSTILRRLPSAVCPRKDTARETYVLGRVKDWPEMEVVVQEQEGETQSRHHLNDDLRCWLSQALVD